MIFKLELLDEKIRVFPKVFSPCSLILVISCQTVKRLVDKDATVQLLSIYTSALYSVSHRLL